MYWLLTRSLQRPQKGHYMRLSNTPLDRATHPTEYFLTINENRITAGTSNTITGTHTMLFDPLVDEHIDWLLNYLRTHSALMIPQIVQCFLSNEGWGKIKSELVRL